MVEKIKQIYSETAGDYYKNRMVTLGITNLWFRKRQPVALNLVAKYHNVGLLLDLGCGNRLWNKSNIPVLGIDISASMLYYNLEHLSHFASLQADIFEGLPVKNNSINTSVITEVLEHFSCYDFFSFRDQKSFKTPGKSYCFCSL